MPNPQPLPTLKNGYRFMTVFKPNRKEDSEFPFLAQMINEDPAPKLILTDDPKIKPGRPYLVQVESIKQPSNNHKGAILVKPVMEGALLDPEALWVDPKVETKIHILLEEGRNILLDGPQGSGKTLLAREIARARNMEYVFFPCSSVYDSSEFLATLQLRSGASGNPETVWLKTDILKTFEAAIVTPGKQYLVFLDEFNRMRGQARNGLMPALDTTRRLFNPITGTTIVIPENVFWIAAINNGDQFVSAEVVDPSQLDRFSPLKVGYPPAPEEEKILLRLRPQSRVGDVQRIVRVANAIRGNRDLGLDLSVRATEEAVIMLANPRSQMLGDDPVVEVIKTSFAGRFQGSWNDPLTDAGQVWLVISKSLKLKKKEADG